MADKHTDNTSYKHSHQKNAKSEAKHLTRSIVPDTIFSDKRQATSDKQQSGISAQSARVNFHTQQYNFTQHNLGLVRGASPLSPQLFVGGKRDTCQTQVSLFPPTAPYLLFNAAKGDTPLETPSVNRKAYKQRFPKSCGGMKIGHPVRFSTRVCSANSHTVGTDRTSCAVAIFQIFYRRNYYENM